MEQPRNIAGKPKVFIIFYIIYLLETLTQNPCDITCYIVEINIGMRQNSVRRQSKRDVM